MSTWSLQRKQHASEPPKMTIFIAENNAFIRASVRTLAPWYQLITPPEKREQSYQHAFSCDLSLSRTTNHTISDDLIASTAPIAPRREWALATARPINRTTRIRAPHRIVCDKIDDRASSTRRSAKPSPVYSRAGPFHSSRVRRAPMVSKLGRGV